MGGGSSFLAAAENTATIALVVGLAPAETNPSAAAAAVNVSIPALILSGDEDAVTPPADHHLLIYNGLGSVCKTFVSILGGGHCYFANSNINCDLGETISGAPTIDRPTQQAILFDVIDPYLKFYLMEDCLSWTDFLTVLANDTRIDPTNDCTYTLPVTPVITQYGTTLTSSISGSLQWYLNGNPLSGETGISVNSATYGNGSYTVSITDAIGCMVVSSPIVIGTSSLDEMEQKIAVQPNPFTNQIVVEVNVKQTVRLLSATNQLLGIYNLEGETIIETAHLASGVYYLSSENGSVTRLVKL
jgi:hypothetical protein